jgi:hypothetical protein
MEKFRRMESPMMITILMWLINRMQDVVKAQVSDPTAHARHQSPRVCLTPGCPSLDVYLSWIIILYNTLGTID